MPIVGEGGKEPNDNFIPQLHLNAHAAIKKLSDMGVGDSSRVAVGGHSYGAFMTANLLAHTKLFRQVLPAAVLITEVLHRSVSRAKSELTGRHPMCMHK
jgi:dipeptidyl aminopeptidase/acylaminoacyl peptidase